MTYSAALLSTGLWLLHPTLGFQSRNEDSSLMPSIASDMDARSDSVAESDVKSTEPYQWPSDHLLPVAPTGFWNTAAETKWADFTLKLSNARVRAEVGKGITITPKNGSPLAFAPDDLVAMAEVPSTGRLIVGDMQGRLRLWDLQAGTPVSLIGQHNAPITSVTYHPRFGLISADRLGNVIRWNINSGLMLATKEFHSTIQSIRCSADGDQLAVMTGRWRDCESSHVSILDSRNLEESMQFVQPYPAATLTELALPIELPFHHRKKRWFSINWQGELRSIQDAEFVLGQIQKDLVSSLVFAQQPVLLDQIAPPPPVRNLASEPTEFIYVER
jgi:WD40 repeat protein